MTRTVIRLDRSGDSVSLNLDRAPVDFDQDSFTIDLDRVTGNTLTERGRSLAALLTERDPLRGVLRSAFASKSNAAPAPIYFHVRSEAADAVAWEQIFDDKQGFCALDPRWPIGRIARTSTSVPGRGFKPPLRLVAVLSAAGQDGSRQLAALLDARAGDGPDVAVHVITGDEAIRDSALAGGATAEFIGGTATALTTQIAQARPHLLHILCHGQLLGGVKSLRFAKISDFDAQVKDFGSMSLPVSVLARALKACDPWLVVLAACQTAAGAGGSSYAHELVNNGVTAVIGMRRLVDLIDTDRFCAELYPSIIGLIRQAVRSTKPGESVPERVIDWAEALTDPRRVMSNPDPDIVDSWLDPVLYAQADDLRVLIQIDDHPANVPYGGKPRPLSYYADLQGKLDVYRGILARLDPAAVNQAAVTEVQTLIAETEALLAKEGE
ncbi:MAG TPA: CHAT domain-containing protein [Jatrophihabitans sp.]|nr:CHAT domain-containing protein [Jatrophihabitans sp.]